jgi:hypothetical protein
MSFILLGVFGFALVLVASRPCAALKHVLVPIRVERGLKRRQ